MIPISDEISTRRVPLVTYGLIALNTAIFLFESSLGSRIIPFLSTFGAVPALVTDPVRHPLAFLTLFTSIFLHGGWAHLIGNMLYLWIFGDNVEDRLGRARFSLFYVGAGVVAGLAQILVAPSSQTPAVGASGAIAGVLAVYLVLYPGALVRVLVPGFFMMRVARVPAAIVLGMWFAIQLLNGFLSLGATTMATGGVAWFAHIGGFAAGLAVGFLLRRRGHRADGYRDPPAPRERERFDPPW